MSLTGSEYELVIGGLPSDANSVVYRDLTELNVTITVSSVGTWSCAVPRDTALAERVLDDVYLYYDGELLFGGRLESVESSYTDSKTKVSGRGVGVQLKTQTDAITYSSTNVHDAIVDYWENHTDFEPIVLPPNRDVLDEEYNTTGEQAVLWGEFGFLDGSPAEPYGAIRSNQLTVERVNQTIDAETSASGITVTDGTDTSNSSYSNGTGVRIDGSTSSGSLSWTTTFDYSNNDPGLHVRLASSTTSATIRFYVGGTETHKWELSGESVSHQWVSVFEDGALTSVNGAPSSINGDTSVEIAVENLASGEYVDIDAIGLVHESAGSYTLPDTLTSDGVYAGPQEYPDGVRIDAYRSSSSYDNVTTSESTATIEALVETDEPTSELTFGMRNVTTGTVQTQTITHSAPQTRHFARFEFGSAGDEFAPLVDLDGVTPPDSQASSGETLGQGVARVELIGPDTSTYVTIDSSEFTGTKFDILGELHDLGEYSFTVTDYGAKNAESFPSDTVRSEPDWTVTDSTRALDYSEYANKVTVEGVTQSDGTYNSATVSDQSEIDALGEPIEKYEKSTDAVTQSEVDSRAQRLLRESVRAKDESGSLSATPQEIPVGFTFPVSNWSRAFTDGSRIGSNALYFREGEPDEVSGKLDEVYDDKNDAYTFEFLIYPEGIKQLDDDEYRALFSSSRDSFDYDIIRLYGDGSVAVNYAEEARSEPGILNEAETQRLSIRWGFAFQEIVFFVDGMELARVDNPITSTFTIDEEYLTIGRSVESTSGGYDYIGGVDDVRLWNHFSSDLRTQAEIREEAYTDLTQEPDARLDDLVVYLRFDDSSTSSVPNDGNPFTQTENPFSVNGAVYDARYGSLEEASYSLGDDGSMELRFNVSNRIGSAFAALQKDVSRNTKYL